MKEIRLRAAPSPTGYIHIGNLRTFLYNYLYVKQVSGKFILRIEDTDQKRRVEGGIEAIINVLQRYGILFDEGPVQGGDYGPYIQTERIDLYQKYADELIEKQLAYRCFCSTERLAEMREQQMKNSEPPGYDGKCRDLSADEVEEKMNSGEKYVIRMKFPKDGITTFRDLVYGELKIPNSSIDDQVLIKSDGLPTYHFAVVIDDHLMKISHVVRGREYLGDTPKTIFLYKAFDWDLPEFVHVPHILKPVGKGKLGKRDGALHASGYLKKGYLPDAILNYIALIGWSPASNLAKESEIYTIEELIQIFDFKGIQKSGGRYDPKKLDSITAKHVRLLTVEDLAERVINWAEEVGSDANTSLVEKEEWEVQLENQVSKYLPLWKRDIEYFKKCLQLVQERITYFGELPELLDFFYDDNLSWTEEDWKFGDHTPSEVANALEEVSSLLDSIFTSGQPVTHEIWESTVRGYADKLGWKHGDLFLAIRSASTGKLQSPPLLESFEVMGWERVKKNTQDAVGWITASL